MRRANAARAAGVHLVAALRLAGLAFGLAAGLRFGFRIGLRFGAL
jgi:hypothetical protein